MAPYQIAETAVRLFAIWLLIYEIKTAAPFLGRLGAGDDATVWGPAVLVAIAIVVIVLILWLFPRSVVRVLVRGSVAAEPTAPSPDAWLMVGCTLLGLWSLTWAIPGLVHAFVLLYLRHRSPAEVVLDPEISAMAIAFLVQFCIGVWLLLGARGLKGLLLRGHHGGSV